jgi:DNA-binding XRE family transcriptional regulator
MYETLRAIRKERGISVNEMCAVIGLETESAYYKKETGFAKLSLVEARKIANHFNLDIESIFFVNELSKMDE